MAKSKKKTIEYFYSKIKTLLIPWFCSGTLVYFYVKLRKGGISIVSLLGWLIGYHTYLYFMTILCFCIILCWNIRKNKRLLYIITIFDCVIFVLLNYFCNDVKIINSLSYLNPINFLMYYSAGVLLASINSQKQLGLICVVLFLSIIISISLLKIKISYFKWYFFMLEFWVIYLVINTSFIIIEWSKIANVLIPIGKVSFSVYLFHMPIAGIIANIFNHCQFLL